MFRHFSNEFAFYENDIFFYYHYYYYSIYITLITTTYLKGKSFTDKFWTQGLSLTIPGEHEYKKKIPLSLSEGILS